jgi:hypothetical protein
MMMVVVVMVVLRLLRLLRLLPIWVLFLPTMMVVLLLLLVVEVLRLLRLCCCCCCCALVQIPLQLAQICKGQHHRVIQLLLGCAQQCCCCCCRPRHQNMPAPCRKAAGRAVAGRPSAATQRFIQWLTHPPGVINHSHPAAAQHSAAQQGM